MNNMTNSTNAKKALKLYGMPWWFATATILVVYLAAYLGVLTTDMAGTLALMLAIAVPLNEIGKRIPIWNKYVGGGLVLTFLGTAALVQWNVIPAEYTESIAVFMDDTNFLTYFIIVLITGSVLSLDRDILLKSFAGYVPAILGGVVGAALLGILGGLVFGVNPILIILQYVLPVMGGGNGGGAIPLSQIYADVTGGSSDSYYAFAIVILTIANIFAIMTAAMLNSLGEKKPEWTGDKKTLLRNSTFEVKDDSNEKVTMNDIGAGLFLGVAAFTFGRVMSKSVLPSILGAPIHQLAYMIIFVVILAATGVVPKSIRLGAKKLQSFITTALTIVVMVGVGADMDLGEFVAALTLQNAVIALLIVIGAILGSAIVGYFVGFYPIDAAITAGLCMANRGGSGDIAVLGAADRMELMAYAQLSSRLGGAIILILGSFAFSFLM